MPKECVIKALLFVAALTLEAAIVAITDLAPNCDASITFAVPEPFLASVADANSTTPCALSAASGK